MNVLEILCLLAMLAAIAALFVLVRKSVLSTGDLPKIGQAIESLIGIIESFPSNAASSAFEQLCKYVQQAVHAVEQMYTKGQIEASERKNTALNMVHDFAQMDGVTLSGQMLSAASNLIEAQCDMMGHADDSFRVSLLSALADDADASAEKKAETVASADCE